MTPCPYCMSTMEPDSRMSHRCENPECPGPCGFVVCDIDGTIANCEHRVHHVRTSPKNWDAFFEAADKDALIDASGLLIRILSSWGFYNVVFCTGRGEEYRVPTTRWLEDVAGIMAPSSWFERNLLMRPAGDRRDDPLVKPELLAARGITPENTAFILEDRNRMVKRWRDLGFTCFQVADGDF